jgi:hypothetical protein
LQLLAPVLKGIEILSEDSPFFGLQLHLQAAQLPTHSMKKMKKYFNILNTCIHLCSDLLLNNPTLAFFHDPICLRGHFRELPFQRGALASVLSLYHSILIINTCEPPVYLPPAGKFTCVPIILEWYVIGVSEQRMPVQTRKSVFLLF